MYPEILPEPNKAIIPQLERFSDFVLSGGTALALQLGHRVSVDFDFFSEALINQKLWNRLKTIFNGTNIVPLVDTTDELTVVIRDVKLTFLYYPYPALEQPVEWSGLKLFSVHDIASTKAQTIGRRSTYKDYFDIYTILKLHQSTLPEIIQLAEKKFEDDFNAKLFLEQLLYTKDIVDTDILLIDNSVTPQKVFRYLRVAVQSIKL